MTNTLFKDGVPYIGAIGQNIARGITPTTSDWDTPPSDLENATDGDPTTATGIGSTTTTGAGSVGTIYFDFGRDVNVLCMLLRRSWSDSSSYNTIPYSSIDGSTYRRGGVEISRAWYTSDPGVAMPAKVFSHYGRYLKLYCYANGAGTHSLVIHEFIALEVIP